MFCNKCGKEMDDRAAFCPACGAPTSNGAQNRTTSGSTAKPEDPPSGGWTALGFFFPVVGLILFLVWRNDYPLRAKACGKGALIGAIISAVAGTIIGIIWGIIWGSVFAGAMGGFYALALL